MRKKKKKKKKKSGLIGVGMLRLESKLFVVCSNMEVSDKHNDSIRLYSKGPQTLVLFLGKQLCK